MAYYIDHDFDIVCFFFNDTATTEIYTLSLHDALPIFHSEDVVEHQSQTYAGHPGPGEGQHCGNGGLCDQSTPNGSGPCRSEEHTSELQLRQYIVCRLLLEKKYNLLVDLP